MELEERVKELKQKLDIAQEKIIEKLKEVGIDFSVLYSEKREKENQKRDEEKEINE